ncbi:MAG: DNA mismatch repair endonuclease MutL [Gammaproteobacteria bacterium]
MTAPRAAIRPLPEHLINQIAAGEVIERPASVVKELVENSLDAGAQRIDVALVDGGVGRIVVSDDGCGIPAAELGAAFSRHWTSKLSSARDLDTIASLGFRGEALASIAAVAAVAVVSRTADDSHAWQVAAAAGDALPAPRPARGNHGCRIEVSELFARIPARRRFLKQPRTEFLHVLRLMRHFAFARPDVAFSLDQPGSRGLRVRPAPWGADAPRWRAVFGAAFVAAASPVALELDGVTVAGWVGGAELAGNQNDLQFIVLNGRVIRDRNLHHAVRAAYGETVPPGSYPAYALALTVALDSVDVNVHPGKLEVRFADLRTVHDILHTAVSQALAGSTVPVPAASGVPLPLGEPPPRAYLRRADVARPPALTEVSWPGRPLALVGRRFLLDEHAGAVRVFDLVECWRRVLAVRLAGPPVPRPLLLPERLDVAQVRALTARAGLAALGFEFADLGPAGGVMRAAPTVLPALDLAAFVRALATAPGDDAASVAVVAAACIALDTPPPLNRRLLDDLARAAGHAGVALATCARPLDAATLARLVEHG